MISYHVNSPRPWWQRLGKPPVIAVFSFRYDSHLVPDLIENISPFVDGWVSYDDRQSGELFSNESKRRLILIGEARKLGARWILAIDPDERLESAAVNRFRALTRWNRNVAWNFWLRELYEPNVYRVDGIWGWKRMPRLFPAFAPDPNAERGLHAHWFPDGAFKIRDTNINLYHLKMISPSRREARRDLYKHLDPEHRYQAIGYDYLTDEMGAQFEAIPPRRNYLPPHSDDGKLWMGQLPSNHDWDD